MHERTAVTATMRAYVLNGFDERSELADIPIPEPGPRDVRVRVRTSSVNPVDVATSAGVFRSMYEYRFPSIQGRDFAGTVDRIGTAVTAFHPGDEVFGMVKRDYIGDGTFAEYVVVPEDQFIASRPEQMDVQAAGALGLAGVTALRCVDALELQPGDSLFINGASGGVGSFAIQIAASRGVRVIATARSADQARHVRDLGATDTVDGSTGDTPAAVRRVQAAGVHGVIDLVSRSTADFVPIAGTAAKGGRAVTTLGAAPSEPIDGIGTANIHSAGDPSLLRHVAQLVVTGSMRVPLADVVPFERIEDAFALLGSSPLGKVGLRF